MKVKRLLITSIFALMASLNVWSIDIYFFSRGSASADVHKADVRKIVFNGNSIDVVQADLSSETLLLDKYDYFTFNSTPTSIALEKDKNLLIAFDGENVSLSALVSIQHVAVYGVDGVKVMNIMPSAAMTSFSLSTLPAGFYVIKAICDGKEVVRKIQK